MQNRQDNPARKGEVTLILLIIKVPVAFRKKCVAKRQKNSATLQDGGRASKPAISHIVEALHYPFTPVHLHGGGSSGGRRGIRGGALGNGVERIPPSRQFHGDVAVEADRRVERAWRQQSFPFWGGRTWRWEDPHTNHHPRSQGSLF